MHCAEILTLLWEYLDGELPPSRAEAVRAHLLVCRFCLTASQVDGALLRRVAVLGLRIRPPDGLDHAVRRELGLG